MAYFIGNQEVSEEVWRANNAAATSSQIGSQFWMNSGYSGPEPSIEVKKALSTAEYARDWIGQYAQDLVGAGVPVQDSVAAMAKDYPVSEASLALWDAVPAISPGAALETRIAEAGGYTGWASSMGVVTANPNTVNNPNSALAPGSPVSGAGAGTVDPFQAPVDSSGGGYGGGSGADSSGSSLLSSLLSSSLLIPAAIFGIFLVLIFMLTRSGSRSGVSA